MLHLQVFLSCMLDGLPAAAAYCHHDMAQEINSLTTAAGSKGSIA